MYIIYTYTPPTTQKWAADVGGVGVNSGSNNTDKSRKQKKTKKKNRNGVILIYSFIIYLLLY